MAYTITHAQLTHLPWIRRLQAEHLREKAEQYPTFAERDLDEFVRVVATAMAAPERFTMLIAEIGRAVVGMLSIEVTERLVGAPHRLGVADLLYVVPRHRGKSIPDMFFRRADEWFRARGVTHVEATALDDTLGYWLERGFQPLTTRMWIEVDRFRMTRSTRTRQPEKGHLRAVAGDKV